MVFWFLLQENCPCHSVECFIHTDSVIAIHTGVVGFGFPAPTYKFLCFPHRQRLLSAFSGVISSSYRLETASNAPLKVALQLSIL
jgi:hypothetical protein